MSWTSWRGKELSRRVESLISEANKKTADAIHAQANQEVPHDEGTLQESGIVLQDPNDKKVWWIGYGGGGASGFPVVPYALKWHEVPANFQKGRKHNYLRDPANQRGVSVIIPNLKKEMNKL